MTPPASVLLYFFLNTVYLACAALVGFAFLTLLLRKEPILKCNLYLRLFFALSCGVALHITLLFCLGLARLFSGPIIGVASCALVMVAAAIATRRSSFSIPQLAVTHSRFSNLILSYSVHRIGDHLSLVAVFIVVASLPLRAPGLWDDTMYHLPSARHYLDSHDLRIDEYLRFPLFPNSMNLLLAFGLTLGGVTMAQTMATLPLFIIAVGFAGLCQQLIGRLPVPMALLATGLFLVSGPIRESAGFAYVDNGLALFCWASFLVLLQLRPSHPLNSRWILLASVLAGTAMDIKLFGLVWAGLLILYVPLATRQFRATLLLILGLALWGSWWYVRSAVISGDPIHPVGGAIFGYFLWNAEDLFQQAREQGTYGVRKNLLWIGQALRKAQIEWVAPAFLTPLVLKRRERCVLLPAYGLFLAYFLCWFFTTQVKRYLAPVLPLACFLSSYVLYRWGVERIVSAINKGRKRERVELIISIVCLVSVGAVACLALYRADRLLNRWTQDLESRPGYLLYQHANSLIPVYGPRLVQVGFENGVFFFQGRTIGDWFGPGRYSQFQRCQEDCQLIDPVDMLSAMALHQSRMLIVNTERVKVDMTAYSAYFGIRYSDRQGYLFVRE